jgi:DNA-directed RNA polymerase subunit RPC12/RpoP
MEIICTHCGLEFKRAFTTMRHGKVLKCPFCSSAWLLLTGTQHEEEPNDPECLERCGKYHPMEPKPRY